MRNYYYEQFLVRKLKAFTYNISFLVFYNYVNEVKVDDEKY